MVSVTAEVAELSMVIFDTADKSLAVTSNDTAIVISEIPAANAASN